MRWIVPLLAVVVGLAVAAGEQPSGDSLREVVGGGPVGRCVWTGGDSAPVDGFLRDWTAQRGGGAVQRWDVGLEDHVARLDLRTDRATVRLTLSLGVDCTAPPVARLVDGAAGAFPARADLDALASGFPAERRQMTVAPRRGPSTGPARLPFIITAFLCLGIAAASAAPRPTAIDAMLVSALVLLAAWPLLLQPFDTDAPVVRAAVVASDVFADSFHPFLPFLLNRPSTWFAFEPWSLRLVPLAFLAAQTMLLMVAAGRDGGRLAAAFAGVWFACEVRRRHGLWDLSDWDFAGTFLMALLLVLQRPWAASWRGTVALALCVGAGLASSYLMIVPAGVMLGSIAIELLRRRWPLGPGLALGALFAALAVLALGVFTAGGDVAPEIDADALWQGMYAELPLARTLGMALPIGLGVVWLVRHLDRVGPRFAAVCLLMVPLAVAIAHRHSHVAGGYYIGLVTPLLLYAAAVGSARAIAGLAPRGRWQRVAVAGLALLVGVVTIDRQAPGTLAPAGEPLRALAARSRADRWPIYTNRTDLGRLLAFERARAAGGGLTIDAVLSGPADVQPRLHVVAGGSCAPSDGGEGFYLVYYRQGDAQRVCVEPLGDRCRSLLDAPLADWTVLRCEP